MYAPWRAPCRICIIAHNLCKQAEPRLVRGLVGVKAWTVQCGHQHSGGDALAPDSNCRASLLTCVLSV